MKRLLFISVICFLSVTGLYAQDENPFAKYGYDVKVVTMTNGRFPESHDRQEVVQIGTVMFNTKTELIAGDVEIDTTVMWLEAQAVSRWISPDPLAEKYYHISPYAYCANNPVLFIDPDGRKIKVYYQGDNGKTYAWNFNGSNQSQAPKNQFVSNFIAAYNYDVKNGGGDNLKAAAIATDYTLNVAQTENGSSFETTFNGPQTEGTVFWNPAEGLETPKGILSPATILEHEIDHGVDWQTNTPAHIKNQNTSDSHFANKEEKRVITGSEYKTGVANGELKSVPKGKENDSSSYRGHMKNSGNTRVTVDSPISNKKKP